MHSAAYVKRDDVLVRLEGTGPQCGRGKHVSRVATECSWEFVDVRVLSDAESNRTLDVFVLPFFLMKERRESDEAMAHGLRSSRKR